MRKISHSKKHDLFRFEIVEELKYAACKSTKQSKFKNTSVLKVKKSEFNLDNGRYLVEVSQHDLIDNEGYSYDFDVLDTEQLCELADELLK